MSAVKCGGVPLLTHVFICDVIKEACDLHVKPRPVTVSIIFSLSYMLRAQATHTLHQRQATSSIAGSTITSTKTITAVTITVSIDGGTETVIETTMTSPTAKPACVDSFTLVTVHVHGRGCGGTFARAIYSTASVADCAASCAQYQIPTFVCSYGAGKTCDCITDMLYTISDAKLPTGSLRASQST